MKRRDQTLDFFFLGQEDLRRAGSFLARQVLAGFRNDHIGMIESLTIYPLNPA